MSNNGTLRTTAILIGGLVFTFYAIYFVEVSDGGDALLIPDFLAFLVLPAGLFLTGWVIRWDKENFRESGSDDGSTAEA